MTHTNLKILKSGRSAWIQMEAIDGLPRLSELTLRNLDRTMKVLKWEGCKGLVLSGYLQGGRIFNFCTGADLHEVSSLEPLAALDFSALGQRVTEQLLWTGWKTLTLLSGVVMGGGCDLALHGQDRWAIESSTMPLRLQHPAALHGLITGFGGTHRIHELVGPTETRALFKNLEVWDGSTCFKKGLVTKIINLKDLESTVGAWQSQLT